MKIDTKLISKLNAALEEEVRVGHFTAEEAYIVLSTLLKVYEINVE